MACGFLRLLRGPWKIEVDAKAIEHALEAQAQFLYAVGRDGDLFSRGGVRDVVAWLDPDPRFAWVMPPEKLARVLGGSGDFHMPVVGAQAARAFRRHGGEAAIFEYEYQMVAGDFLDRVPSALPEWPSDTLNEHGYPPHALVTFIPEPGYPWPVDQYYSARRDRWLRSERPPWILSERIVDEARGIDSFGVDLCRLFEPEASHKTGAVLGRYGKRSGDVFMATHAMRMHADSRDWTERAAESVKQCGGLLFPSLAVGPVPATNFGPCILIADVGIVVNSLKPLRARGASSSVHVFDTDAWTGRSSEFLRDAAISAFEQLHGHSDYVRTYDLNVWSLGPPGESYSGPAEANRLDRVAQLKRELAERFRIWRRGLEPAEIGRMEDAIALTKARYGYLEAKVTGVLPVREFPVAVAPKGQSDEFERFLGVTGFAGDLLRVELPDELRQIFQFEGGPLPRAMSAALEVFFDPEDTETSAFDKERLIRTWADLQYGWHVHDVVREKYPQVVQL